MFVRVKNSHGYKYLQIVESKREGKKVKQRVLATLGQLDALSESGSSRSDRERTVPPACHATRCPSRPGP
ncbi:MAG: hypothetical protein ABSG21_17405, partial [Spirochaetia bacterium]